MLTVKDNQKYLKKNIEELFNSTLKKFPELIRSASTLCKGHGRLEERSITTLSTQDIRLGIFNSVKQIAILTRKREILNSGKKSSEIVYLISNIDYDSMSADQFLDYKRNYWFIENKLHYVKDFVFGEDRATMRKGHGAQNMASLRNFAIGLFSSNGINNIKRCVDNLRSDPSAVLKLAA